jgi:putative transposase
MPNTPMGYRRRNSLRHKSFDYTSAAAYFVTICVDHGRCVFGQIVDSVNPLGQIADQAWARILKNHPNAQLDTHVVMPNHGHAVLWLHIDPDQPPSAAPVKARRFGDAIAGSLSTLVNSYKSSVTQQAQHRGLLLDGSFWQSNFHDHIVRGDQELQRIRDYIQSNPARWLEDQLHPKAPINQFNRTWNRENA